MHKKYWLIAILFFMSSIAYAVDLEIALSEDTANIEVSTESDTFGFSGSDLNAGLFFNDDDDFAIYAGLLVDGTPAGDQPFTYGLGGKIYYIDTDIPNATTTAIALGAGMKYHIPARMPMAVGADLYFAPDITAFGDADSVLDFRVRFEMDVLPNATAFVGYRKFEIDLDKGGDYELDDNPHLGIRFQF
ncbi:MAG TPA: hypothetical protein EYH06_09485 [Chromatiales bacterium]|nr:hypothetical protein [Thiotrichales bacterium]HIP68808.1 hypothetical protein [Chromatiales bacterium]